MTSPDPVTTEIIRNSLISCAEDMNATLIRSAYTPIIYEGKDCAVALLDENGDVLGQSVGVPLFLGNLEVCVKSTAEQLGWGAFRPGDIFHVNDAYITGTHLNDATIFGPVHWKDRLVGFVATRAHWLDVGAKDPGGPMDSHEIYQEGMRWGPTRIYSGGEPREDILDLLRRNGRFGYSLIGDMHAQVAACRTGNKRLNEVLDRFGYETFVAARDEVFRQSEAIERQAVEAIPDGVYVSEGALDNDGLDTQPVVVKVRVEVRGQKMTIDLTGSSEQTRGPVNCGFAQTISACRMAFKLLVTPKRAVDGGTFRTLNVVAPQSSIFSAQEPAACHWYFTPLGLLIDLVIKALADAMPNAVAAAHYGDSMVIYVSGRDPRHGSSAFLSVEPTAGGWGASKTSDGQDGLINVVNGAFKDIPIEVYEAKYPLTITEYGFRPDTGGAGTNRGGCGLRRVYRLDAPASVSLWFERSRTVAWGVFGGDQGAPPEVVINRGRDAERHLLKANSIPLNKGDTVEVMTGGGGGYGRPSGRDPRKVRQDVDDGYVTRKAASRDYRKSTRGADIKLDEVEAPAGP